MADSLIKYVQRLFDRDMTLVAIQYTRLCGHKKSKTIPARSGLSASLWHSTCRCEVFESIYGMK